MLTNSEDHGPGREEKNRYYCCLSCLLSSASQSVSPKLICYTLICNKRIPAGVGQHIGFRCTGKHESNIANMQ